MPWITEPAEEQQRLEEGVRDHVEDRSNVEARANSHHHESELAHGGVSEHLLDVVLGDGNRGREQGSEEANPGNDIGAPTCPGFGDHGLIRVSKYTPEVTMVAA